VRQKKKRRREQKHKSILQRFRQELRDQQSETDCARIVIVPGQAIHSLPASIRRQAKAHFKAGAVAVLVLIPYEEMGA
jgi:hypothetical protein